jgi:hypothetical protein
MACVIGNYTIYPFIFYVLVTYAISNYFVWPLVSLIAYSLARRSAKLHCLWVKYFVILASAKLLHP